MTARQNYGRNLRTIRKASGQLHRRLTYQEARTLVRDMRAEMALGYPTDLAIQRAYDCHYAAKRGRPLWG